MKFPIQLKVREGISHPIKKNIKLFKNDSIFFMGICGTAMASLAVLMKNLNFFVQGTDKNIYPPMSDFLNKHKISVFEFNSESKKKLKQSKLVIVGNVMSKHYPEITFLDSLKIPYTSLPEFLEQSILKDTKNIVISGTHGKTTTTSLMGEIAKESKNKFGFFVAGIPSATKEPFFYQKDSDYFIIEGDEYDTAFFTKRPKFFYYKPFFLIVTGIDFDHADIYKNEREILNVFSNLFSLVPKDGLIVVHSECKNIKKIIDQEKDNIKPRIVTYGILNGDYQIKNRSIFKEKQKFQITFLNQSFDCETSLLGEHNALNITAAFALSNELNWNTQSVLKGIKKFQGVEKRLKKINDFSNGISLFEDFAHHPVAVRKTLEAVKESYPDRKISLIFEPRSYTCRTNIFQKDFVNSFLFADKIFIFKPFDLSKIPLNFQIRPKEIVKNLEDLDKLAFYVEDFNLLCEKLLKHSSKNEILLIVSNGNFGNLKEILNNLFLDRSKNA